MNLDSHVTPLGTQIARSVNNVDAALISNLTENPHNMLKSQFAWAQYSALVGYESAVMKAVKDMLMGIISKI
ncbi:hypothetical protein BLA50215_07907 [Burkholderia lata]|uniref:type III secretion system needle filament subunit SctF n=1 Tax=Burkholderia lata (strain ATCC 17760 / DSM 23089 / LMG 22485 / NCIMB 9086 / R18194 / 383) TaxID=482957 RepID=UPI001453F6AA|nr:type III secretion system needle filament subunit SctF [Burkholderia lata]VWD64752.1 hypothetical protein BLA50215_07907 [Burkholderia lata]